MAVQIALTQTRETAEEGYEVQNEILDGVGQTVGIDPELFVFQYVDGGSNDIYQNVATVAQVKELPKTGDTGWNTNGAMYRKNTANLVYTDLDAAQEQAAYIKTRLAQLATDYEDEVVAYEGLTEVINYQSADGNRSLTLDLSCTQTASAEYYVLATILAGPTGIEQDVFTFKLVGSLPDPTDEFERIMTIYDRDTYPNKAGWTAEAYYRHYEESRTFTYLSDALARIDEIKTGLAALVEEYDEYTDEFSGSETTYYNG